jgi:hypothetical protein
MAEDWKPGSNVLRISSVSIAHQKPCRNTQSDRAHNVVDQDVVEIGLTRPDIVKQSD